MRYIINFDACELETLHTGCLVIGTGVAGLRAAIEASRYGDVTVITKAGLQEGCTWFAQGGVAVAISGEDSPELHISDTLEAGAGLCNVKAVRILVEEGIKAVEQLLSWGAKFDRINGKLAFSLEGAHRMRRIIHATGDATGEEIHRALLHHAKKIQNIKFLEHVFLADLLTKENECFGAAALDKDGKPFIINSKATVMAAGGLGQIYKCSTNPQVATGDGFSAAFRAGCRLRDLEFIQFHPTILYMPGAEPFLISEATRGEGGRLKNTKGRVFMRDYHKMGDLAPRDVVSRAIFSQMYKTGAPHVYLDMKHLKASLLRKRFPNIYQRCKGLGIDITQDLIPVRPAAHFAMGGIDTNLETETNIKRLFSCGEAACSGVHGANRLASNSLLEGLVFGKRAGQNQSKYSGCRKSLPRVKNKGEEKEFKEAGISRMREELKSVMEAKVGIIRCGESLKACLKKIKKWNEMINYPCYNKSLLELKNMLTAGELITRSALKREESRGAHYRSDYPLRDDATWQKSIFVREKARRSL